jgi:hypothetical protein
LLRRIRSIDVKVTVAVDEGSGRRRLSSAVFQMRAVGARTSTKHTVTNPNL